MRRDKQLCDFVGRNEKTKLVVKLQKRGGGAPAREPVVDEATQKQLMAHAYRKQQELEKLQTDDSDACVLGVFLSSSWFFPQN